ncbi:MAG: Metallo-dependent phosphatase [Microgenomates bacterium 39_7]|nr:MAG: Metallo-dependent phosphatase [Microgenomates bacterium 39_7]
MKILIFSDTHLTNKFDQRKFNLLKEIINSSDQVVINGDFWDGWFTNFDGFINSQWKKLFPLLLKKNTVYLYGNHDPPDWCDTRVNLFSVNSGESHDLLLSNAEYHIEHGHKLLKKRRSRLLKAYHSFLKKIETSAFNRIIYNFLHLMEDLGYKLVGESLVTDSRIAKKNNEVLKQANQGNRFLICGDTHCAQIDQNHLFANSGCINYGYASYLLINDGEITLKKSRY